MIKKSLIFLFVTLVLVNTLSAEILIQPMNVSVKKNIQSDFYLNISNTYNFDVYNLELNNLNGFIFPSINISAGSNVLIPFSVKTNYSFDGNLISNVKFKYLANIPEAITTYDLTITNQGINGKTNNYITIRKGDTIRFINNDVVTHNIQSTTFENTLAPNGIFARAFNDLGIFNYQTQVAGIIFYTGTIEVINRTGSYLVYNQLYDSTYTLYLNSVSEPTNLSIIITSLNYSIDPSGFKESLITISNIGNLTAEKIHISSDLGWITPDEQDFNLNPSDTKYIKIKILPQIFSTNQTNQTYLLNLNIKASNTENYNSALNIFIPYSNAFGDLSSEQGFITWFTNVYCPANPQSFLCNTSARDINESAKIIYRESEYSVNMSGSEWYNLVKRIGMIEDTMSRDTNKQQQDTGSIITDITFVKNQTNETYNKVNNFIEDQNTKSQAYWIIGTALFICLCLITIVFSIRKLTKKKEVVDIYNYS